MTNKTEMTKTMTKKTKQEKTRQRNDEINSSTISRAWLPVSSKYRHIGMNWSFDTNLYSICGFENVYDKMIMVVSWKIIQVQVIIKWTYMNIRKESEAFPKLVPKNSMSSPNLRRRSQAASPGDDCEATRMGKKDICLLYDVVYGIYGSLILSTLIYSTL